jgi:hypothetical protein
MDCSGSRPRPGTVPAEERPLELSIVEFGRAPAGVVDMDSHQLVVVEADPGRRASLDIERADR